MPSALAHADSAIRLSVACLVNTWSKLKPQNRLFRLKPQNRLVNFPNGHWGNFSVSSACYNFGSDTERGTGLYTVYRRKQPSTNPVLDEELWLTLCPPTVSNVDQLLESTKKWAFLPLLTHVSLGRSLASMTQV
jgi:hypothetical protein